MTDDDLREQVERLTERVRELEKRLDAAESGETASGVREDVSPTSVSSCGTDHRDDAVLSVVRRTDSEPSPYKLVKLYKTHTDISQDSTAKKRAKQLRKTPAYSRAVEK